MVELVLASTLHDPENRLEGMISQYGRSIKEAFQKSCVVVTPATPESIVTRLRSLSFSVLAGSRIVPVTYRKALAQALTTQEGEVFYCDFDRLLHWIKTYPNELEDLSNMPRGHDFMILGRTQRAFQTHPRTQTTTESIANHIASKFAGLQDTKDIISACWKLSPRIAEVLIQLPFTNLYGFYCEWPLVALKRSRSWKYLEVEGLEWETPDRFAREIREKGYNRWRQEFQTLSEWRIRIEILSEVVQSISKYA